MKFNFLIRLKNKAFLLTFIPTLIAFIYQLFALFGYVPSISEDEVLEFVGLIVTFLANIGILIDPTTKGFSDSKLVMSQKRR